MKYSKKIIALILAIVTIFSAVSISASAITRRFPMFQVQEFIPDIVVRSQQTFPVGLLQGSDVAPTATILGDGFDLDDLRILPVVIGIGIAKRVLPIFLTPIVALINLFK